jgi:putative transposase
MRYRRSRAAGGKFFFTLALEDRRATTLVDGVDRLRVTVAQIRQRHPFTIDAFVVLPDHLHAVWTLPAGDVAYSLRWSLIKAGFSRGLPQVEAVAASRARRGERGVWQRRFWEHQIRDDTDFEAHVNYIHFNPVRHGLAARASEWPYSSIHKYIRQGTISVDWADDRSPDADFGEPQEP